MVLCFRQVGSAKEIISGKDSEVAFKELVRRLGDFPMKPYPPTTPRARVLALRTPDEITTWTTPYP